MKRILRFQNPLEPFNSMVKDGSVGAVIGKILEDLKPEAVNFTASDGKRGGIMVVNINDASEIPRYAEPFFLKFNSTVELWPCMEPEDLMRAQLDDLGRTWG